LKTEEEFKKFFVACILVLMDKFKESSKKYSAERLQEELMEEDEHSPTIGGAFWTLVVNKSQAVPLTEGIELIDHSDAHDFAQTMNPICFAFDEARFLLTTDGKNASPFRECRRALTMFADSNMKVVAVFTDTTSAVANFSPSVDQDSSARASSRNELAAPEVIVPGWLSANLDNVGSLIKDLEVHWDSVIVGTLCGILFVFQISHG
jgi:hypothetical protein